MIVFRFVRRQFQAGEDRAQKQPGAELARDQIGVLALPAHARFLRQRFFHHRRGIDEHFHLGAIFPEDFARHLFELLLDQIVIVIALGIDRNRAAILAAPKSPAGRCPGP